MCFFWHLLSIDRGNPEVSRNPAGSDMVLPWAVTLKVHLPLGVRGQFYVVRGQFMLSQCFKLQAVAHSFRSLGVIARWFPWLPTLAYLQALSPGFPWSSFNIRMLRHRDLASKP